MLLAHCWRGNLNYTQDLIKSILFNTLHQLNRTFIKKPLTDSIPVLKAGTAWALAFLSGRQWPNSAFAPTEIISSLLTRAGGRCFFSSSEQQQQDSNPELPGFHCQHLPSRSSTVGALSLLRKPRLAMEHFQDLLLLFKNLKLWTSSWRPVIFCFLQEDLNLQFQVLFCSSQYQNGSLW